jgi:sugar O-acyltransferase (sialic acid O-acetyltransferase NeuD family)
MVRVLIGSGSHAAVVYEIAQQKNLFFDAFVDPSVHVFKNLKKMNEYDSFFSYFVGIGGMVITDLLKRQSLYENYKRNNYKSFNLISNYSYVSELATIGDGTLIAHHAVIQTEAKLGENNIINTGTIIEHDAIIEDGCHIAPGAIILGGARVGSCSMIGAGAVILPYQIVPSQTLVPALTRYKNDK